MHQMRADALSISATQFGVVHGHRKLRELVDHVLRRVEQDAGVGFGEHRRVVVGIAGGDDLEVEFLEALHRFLLLVRHAQMVVHHEAGRVGFQLVAEQHRHVQLRHQRHGELVEGVGQDDDLEIAAQGVEEIAGAIHRPHVGNHLLDVGQTEQVLLQQVQPVLHQLVVVRLVAGGAGKLRDAGALGKLDPYFGNEHAFEVETDELH
jgi:hypothetical protein